MGKFKRLSSEEWGALKAAYATRAAGGSKRDLMRALDAMVVVYGRTKGCYVVIACQRGLTDMANQACA